MNIMVPSFFPFNPHVESITITNGAPFFFFLQFKRTVHVWTVKQALSSWLGRKFSALFKMEALIFLHQKCIYHLLEMRSGTFWRKFPQRMGTKSFPGYLITVSVCLGVFQVPLPLTCQNMWGLLALTATWIKSDWQGIQLRSNSEFNRPEFLW